MPRKRRQRKSPEKALILYLMDRYPFLVDLKPKMKGLTVPQMHELLNTTRPGPYKQLLIELQRRQGIITTL